MAAAETDSAALINALNSGSGDSIKTALSGLDAKTFTTEDGYTALHLAVFSKKPAAVKAVLDAGADVEARVPRIDFTPLILAANHAAFKLIPLLVSKGANIEAVDSSGATALHHVAKNYTTSEDCEEAIRTLLTNSADINARTHTGVTPLWMAASEGKPVSALLTVHDADSQLCRTIDGLSPLGAATIAGHSKIIKHFDPSDLLLYTVDGTSPFYFAAQMGDEDTANALALLSLQDDIVRDTAINAQHASGATALFAAASHGHEEILKVLLALGARVDVRCNDTFVAAHKAAGFGQWRCLLWLILCGTDVNEKTLEKEATLLFAAAQGGSEDAVTLLLCLGADRTARTVTGLTAADVAAQCGHDELSSFLRDEARCYSATCGKASSSRCTRCGLARYCSKDCQKSDWSARHKVFCEAVGLLRARAEGDPSIFTKKYKHVEPTVAASCPELGDGHDLSSHLALAVRTGVTPARVVWTAEGKEYISTPLYSAALSILSATTQAAGNSTDPGTAFRNHFGPGVCAMLSYLYTSLGVRVPLDRRRIPKVTVQLPGSNAAASGDSSKAKSNDKASKGKGKGKNNSEPAAPAAADTSAASKGGKGKGKNNNSKGSNNNNNTSSKESNKSTGSTAAAAAAPAAAAAAAAAKVDSPKAAPAATPEPAPAASTDNNTSADNNSASGSASTGGKGTGSAKAGSSNNKADTKASKAKNSGKGKGSSKTGGGAAAAAATSAAPPDRTSWNEAQISKELVNAIKSQDLELVKELVSLRAFNPATTLKKKQSFLHVAATSTSIVDICSVLAGAGVDVTAEDSKGNTAPQLALRQGDPFVASFLDSEYIAAKSAAEAEAAAIAEVEAAERAAAEAEVAAAIAAATPAGSSSPQQQPPAQQPPQQQPPQQQPPQPQPPQQQPPQQQQQATRQQEQERQAQALLQQNQQRYQQQQQQQGHAGQKQPPAPGQLPQPAWQQQQQQQQQQQWNQQTPAQYQQQQQAGYPYQQPQRGFGQAQQPRGGNGFDAGSWGSHGSQGSFFSAGQRGAPGAVGGAAATGGALPWQQEPEWKVRLQQQSGVAFPGAPGVGAPASSPPNQLYGGGRGGAPPSAPPGSAPPGSAPPSAAPPGATQSSWGSQPAVPAAAPSMASSSNAWERSAGHTEAGIPREWRWAVIGDAVMGIRVKDRTTFAFNAGTEFAVPRRDGSEPPRCPIQADTNVIVVDGRGVEFSLPRASLVRSNDLPPHILPGGWGEQWGATGNAVGFGAGTGTVAARSAEGGDWASISLASTVGASSTTTNSGNTGGWDAPSGCRIYTAAEVMQITNNCDPSRQIGAGTYGTVFRGVFGGVNVAVKVLKPDAVIGLSLKREAECLAALAHPHIIQLMGVCPSDEISALIYPEMECSFAQVLARRSMDLSGRIRVLLQTAYAVAYLHSQPTPLLHRDIKASNILIEQLSRKALLADFGITRSTEELASGTHLATSNRVGTAAYMAPEYLHGGTLSVATDVFSLGVVTLEAATCSPASDSKRDPPLLYNWVAEQLDEEVPAHELVEGATPEMSELAERLLELGASTTHQRRKKRPTLDAYIEELTSIATELETFATANDQTLAMYLDPITGNMMTDPVVAADGLSYERASFEAWIAAGNTTSPVTNNKLDFTQCVPNIILKQQIEAHLASR